MIVKLQVERLRFGGTNNILKISNSTIAEGSDNIIISGNTNKLYIGKGCNFTSSDTTYPEVVETTDETYKK